MRPSSARAALRWTPPISHPTIRIEVRVWCTARARASVTTLSRAASHRRSHMEIIPVIDLKGDTVVHARMGRRDDYRPIRTPLSATSDPVDVTRGLLSIHPFTTLYVADLDAIERRDDNRPALDRLK